MKKKSILVFLTLLIGVAILFVICQSHYSSSKKNDGTKLDSNIILDNENTQNDGENIIPSGSYELTSIEEAFKDELNGGHVITDYETTTNIILASKDRTYYGTADSPKKIIIPSGATIKLSSIQKELYIGSSYNGYTFTLGEYATIELEQQANLIIDTNFEIDGGSLIANGSDTNPEFNPTIAINDNFTVSAGEFNTTGFSSVTVNGTINLIENGTIIGSTEIKFNDQSGIIHLNDVDNETTLTTTLNGSGLYVTNAINTPTNVNLVKKVTDATLYSGTSSLPQSGVNILQNDITLSNVANINSNLELIPLNDITINVGTNCYFNIRNNSLSLGGIKDGDTFYSIGSNELVLDGGANWSKNGNGNKYYFVTEAYDASMNLLNSEIENFGRETYALSGSTSVYPLVSINSNQTSTLNLAKSTILRNRVNTQSAESGSYYIGAGVAINSGTLNIYGGKILYNALPDIGNAAGGAGVGSINGTINMYDGEINYNTTYRTGISGLVFDGETRSTDGVGISLIDNSTLNMHDGIIGYNHGSLSYSADGAGVMVRRGGNGASNLNITGGEISYNFAYGYGGGICVWESTVEISGGLLQGNRSTYGGGVSTNADKNHSSVTLKASGNNKTQILGNSAFTPQDPGDRKTGYGGGVSLGTQQFNYNQSLTINDAEIKNNSAIYGGGISNVTSGNENRCVLTLSGGTISNNKTIENKPENGYGIYCYNLNAEGNSPMISMSGDIQVDTSNNIVFANITKRWYNNSITQTPIEVTGELTATGIVGLIAYSEDYSVTSGGRYYQYSAPVVKFNNSVQSEKFLLDNSTYYLIADGNTLEVTSNNKYIAYINSDTSANQYNNLSEAVNAAKDGDIIYLIRPVALDSNDLFRVTGNKSITITSSGTERLALSLANNITNTDNLDAIMTIEAGSSLTLKNIIFDGNSSSSNGYMFVNNRGTFILEEDATLRNNYSTGTAGAINISAESETIIKGIITGNIGHYGAIYVNDVSSTINIESKATIQDNRNLEDENIDITVSTGTLNLNNAKNIGYITYNGGRINANDYSGDIVNKIQVYVHDIFYRRNTSIIYTPTYNANNDPEELGYTKYFNLANAIEGSDYENDSFKQETRNNSLIINMTLKINLTFATNYDGNKFETLTDVYTSTDLVNIKNELGLHYDVKYQTGDKTLVLRLESDQNLALSLLLKYAQRSGYQVNNFINYSINGQNKVYSTTYSTTADIDSSSFSDSTNEINLCVQWGALEFTFIFDNGGLTTANKANKPNDDFGEFKVDFTELLNNTHLPINQFYAVGFYFKNWKVSGTDIYWENGQQLDDETIIALQGNSSNTEFKLEAQWGNIFSSNNDISDIGTNQDMPFAIYDEDGLKVLAETVSGIGNGIFENKYQYYNGKDENGNLVYKANDYANYYFILMNDNINVTNIVIGDLHANVSVSTNSNIDFGSIVADPNNTPFSGIFNGNNKTIDLTINDGIADKNFVGLFGYTKDANISNLTVSGNVKGNISVGGIIGLAYGGTYKTLTNKANVEFTGVNAGGVIGTYYIESSRYSNGSITDVLNMGSVSYNGDRTNVPYGSSWTESEKLYAYEGSRAGGVVGQTWHAIINEAYNSGNITAKFGVGGIVGTMMSLDDNTRSDSVINTAFNIGNVTATAGLGAKYQYSVNGTSSITKYQVNAYVGGIVGRMFGASTLDTVMNDGNISATWRGTYQENQDNVVFSYNTNNPTVGGRGVGGILGVTSIKENTNGQFDGGNKTVNNVINTGKVEGWTHVGGVAGIFAYSDLSYAINVGEVTAKGTLDYLTEKHAFLGGLVGMGVAANINNTSIANADLQYNGKTDSTIQVIGDENASVSLGFEKNNNNGRKLSSSYLICQTGNTRPRGLDSTFFDSGWIWNSYDDDNYYYYPQFNSFAEEKSQISQKVITSKNETVHLLSKEAVKLVDNVDKPIEESTTVTISLNLGNGNTIESPNMTTSDGAVFSLVNGIYQAELNFVNYRYKELDLDSLASELTYESYHFDGWYRDPNFTEKFDGVISSEDITLYLKWSPNDYNITLTGLQKYANGDVSLDGDSNFKYNIVDAENGRKIDLPKIVINNAYEFVSWQIFLNGVTYDVDCLEINVNSTGGYTLTLSLNGVNQGEIYLDSLMALDFTLNCAVKEKDIIYEFVNDDDVNDDDDKNSLDSSLFSQSQNVTYNINSAFDLYIPTSIGYNYQYWTYEGEVVQNISEVINKLGVEGLDKITLVCHVVPKESNLIIDLGANASFNNIDVTIGGYKFSVINGLYTATGVKYGADISWLWVNDNYKNIINSPEGYNFVGIYPDRTNLESEKPQTMPEHNLTVYAVYNVTTYNITIDAGNLGENNLTFDKTYATLDSSLAYGNGILTLKAKYGSSIEEILIKIREQLEEKNTLGQYHFSNYDATYKDGIFSIYNVRINTVNPTNLNLKVTFIWSTTDYTIAIYDSLNNYIADFTSSSPDIISWCKNNIITISDLETYLETYNFTIPSGYLFDNKQFTISVANNILYDGVEKTPETITINGYTAIRLVLEPKVYNIEFKDNEGNPITSLGNYQLSYSEIINTANLPIHNINGYDFAYWVYNDQPLVNNSTFIPTDGDVKKEKIVLQGHWTPARYNIIFEYNADYYWNGSISNSEINVTYNSSNVTLTNQYFKIVGYTYNGAKYNNNPITVIDNEFLETLGEKREAIISIELNIIQIEITFDADNGYYEFNDDDVIPDKSWYLDSDNNKVETEPSAGTILEKYVILVNYYDTANNNLPINPINPGNKFRTYAASDATISTITQLSSNATFVAQWDAENYTITLTSVGYTNTIENLRYNQTINLDNYSITREGYKFLGWDDLSTATTIENLTGQYTVTKSVVLEAKWQINSYTLTFNFGSLENVDKIKAEILVAIKLNLNWDENSLSIPYNTNLNSLNNITINGQLLIYYIDENSYSFNTMPANELSVDVDYADKYKIITGEIYFDILTDPSPFKTVQFVALKQENDSYKIQTYTNLSFEGYTFDNVWTYNGETYNGSEILNIEFSEATSITAKILKIKYLIQVQINTPIKDDIVEVEAYHGETIKAAIDRFIGNNSAQLSVPGFTIDHYEINGTNVDNLEVTQNYDIDAIYTAVTYFIKFEYEGEQIGEINSYQYDSEITYIPTINDLSDLANYQYYEIVLKIDNTLFADLFKNNKMPNLAEFENEYDSIEKNDDGITATITITTTLKEFKVNIIGNNVDNNISDKSYSFKYDPRNDNVVINFDDSIEVKYYNFLGISTDKTSENPLSDYKFSEVIKLFDNAALEKGSLNVYLIYKAIDYKIKYNIDNHIEDGPTFTCEDQMVEIKSVYKDKYNFVGWVFDIEDESATIYKEYIDVADLLNNINNNEVVLYAKYKPISYTVLFYDKATNISKTLSYPYGTTYKDIYAKLDENSLQHPERPGYVDGIWTDGTNQLTNDSEITIQDATVFTIDWEAETYNIIVKDDENSEAKSIDVIYDKEVNLNVPTKEGYTFIGWYSGDELIVPANGSLASWNIDLSNVTNYTIIGQWEPNAYNIIYNGNGATSGLMENDGATYGSEVTLTTNTFIREGYEFKGWATSVNGEISYTDEQVFAYNMPNDLELYAVWEPISYNLRFSFDSNDNLDNNLLPTELTIEYDEPFTMPTIDNLPKGYRLIGWVKDDTTYNLNNVYSNLRANRETIILTAEFEYSYTIIFDTNGGTPSISSQEEIIDNNLNLIEYSGKKTGYTFAYWEYNGTEISNVDLTNNPGAEIIVKAHWTPITYNIKFDANPILGTTPTGEMANQEITYDEPTKLTENKFVIEGYKFLGWATEENGIVEYRDGEEVVNLTSTFNETVTLYAVWEKEDITLTIDVINIDPSQIRNVKTYLEEKFIGAEINNTENSITIIYQKQYGVSILDIVDIIKSLEYNYTINEKTYNLIKPNINDEIITTPLNYTLQFSEGEFALTINVVHIVNSKVIVDKVITYPITVEDGSYTINKEDLMAEVNNLSLTGYTLNKEKWYIDDSCTNEYDFNDNLEEPTLYVKFEPINYTVSFNKNNQNATGSMESQDFTYDELKTISNNQFSLEGYTFIGWATEENGIVEYRDGEEVVNLTSTFNETVTLYAVWELNVYEVKVYLDSTSTDYLTLYYEHGTNIFVLDNIYTKVGYTFVNWLNKDDDKEFTETTITANISLYANWEEITYSITYIGSTIDKNYATSYTINTENILPTTETATINGYIVKGWTLKEGSNEHFTYIKGSTIGNLVLYAILEPIEYSIILDKNKNNIYDEETDKKINNVLYGSSGDIFYGLIKDITLPNNAQEVFKGWADNTGKLITNESVFAYTNLKNNQLFLYPVFENNAYSITIMVDGGIISTINNVPYTTNIVDAIKDIVSPTKDYYQFSGWLLDGTLITESSLMPAQNIILNAQFTTIQYKLTITSELNNPVIIDDFNVEYSIEDLKEKLILTGYNLVSLTNNDIILSTIEDIIELADSNKEITISANYEISKIETTLTISNIVNVDELDKIDSYIKEQLNDYSVETTNNVSNNNIILTIIITTDYNTDLNSILNSLLNSDYFDDSYEVNDVIYIFNEWQNVENTITNKTYDASYEIGGYVVTINQVVDTTTPDSINVLKDENDRFILKKSDIVDYEKTSDLNYEFVGWFVSDEEQDFFGNETSKEITGPLTLYARFELKDIIIKFDVGVSDNSVTGNMEDQIVKSSKATQLNENMFRRLGYEFVGWATEENGDVVYGDAIEITLFAEESIEITLYAKWNIITYNIQYNGATGDFNNIYNVNDSIILPTEVDEKPGYTFVCWLDVNGEPITEITKGTTGDITLTAKWNLIEYNIIYNLNDDSIDAAIDVGNNPNTYTIESPNITIINPTRPGYTFAGWKDSTDATANMNYVINTGTIGDITLTATWTPNNYQITYDVNGGNELTSNIKNVTYQNVIGDLAVPTRDNYRFVGWYYGNVQITKDSTYSYKQDIVVVARWEAVEYNITYNLNDGINNSGNADKYSVVNNVIFKDPTRAGYEFTGWTYEGNPITSTTGLAINITVVANWKPIEYQINYENIFDGTNDNPISYNIESNDIIINEPTRIGYTFIGWTDGSVTTPNMEYTISKGSTGNITLTANWQANTYNIIYNVDGGSHNNDDSFTYDDDFVLNDASKEGYTFIGWYYNNIEITNKEDISRYAKDNSITLVAKYKIKEITITLNINNIPQVHVASIIRELNTALASYSYVNISETQITTTINTSNLTIIIKDVYNKEINIKSLISTNLTTLEIDGITYKLGEYSSSLEDYNYNIFPNENVTITVSYVSSEMIVNLYVDNEFKAHYTVQNITNDSYDLSDMESNGVYLGVFELNQYQKEGYQIDGWYNLKDTENKYDFATTQYGQLNLYAYNRPNTYTIKFDLVGGEGTFANIPATYDKEEVLNGVVPTKVGYTFLGWALDSNATTPDFAANATLINLTNVNNDEVTLYAVWKANQYRITFDGNGATLGSINPITFDYANKVDLPSNTYQRTGYIFLGWSEDKNDKDAKYTNVYNEDLTATSDITLYAIWQEITYNIYFEDSGNSINEIKYTQEVNVPTISKEGYTFIGWTDGKNTYEVGTKLSKLTITNDKTVNLKAVWQANTYTIIYNNNGGIGNMANQVFTYDVAKALNANTFTKTGYEFIGWATEVNGDVKYLDKQEVNNLSSTNNAEIILYAFWEEIEFTIIFDANSGNGSMEEQTFTYDEYEALNANAFTKTGYTFIGWNTNKEATTALYNDLEVVGNLASTTNEEIRLYAIWQVNTYTITFNLNGGNVVNDIADINLNYGQTATLNVEEPTRTGYIFGGWSYNGNTYNNYDELSNLTDINNAIIEFVAIWNSITYQVQFVDDESKVETIDLTYDKYYQIDITNPSKVGYNFTHWSDEDNNQYVFGDILFNLTETNGDTITLTANYEIINYNITYIFNGNISGSYDTTYNVENEKINLPTPTLAGYDFAGWYDESLNDEFNYIQGQITGDLILYAKFEAYTYTISYNIDSKYNVENIDNKTIKYGKSFTSDLLPNITSTGYVFIGWFKDDNQQIIVGMPYLDTKNITLNAKFVEDKYNVYFDMNGGNEIEPMADVANGSNIKIEYPTRIGYTFLKFEANGNEYFVDSEGYIIDKNDDKFILNGTITFKAIWENNTYKVQFIDGENIDEQTFTYDVSQNLNTPFNKTGYVLRNWEDENGNIYNVGEEVINLTSNNDKVIKLTANWREINYIIKFDLAGGSGEFNDISATYNEEIKLGLPSKIGYTFACWSYNNNTYQENENVSMLTTVDNDVVTLEAKWTANKYYINFIVDGESDGNIKLTYDEPYVLNHDIPTRPGYTFAGWSYNNNIYYNGYTLINLVPNDSIDFVATWKTNNYTITYNTLGGNYIESININYGENINLTIPTRTGYDFDGWYTDIDLNDEVKKTYIYTTNITVYPKWEAITYTISFNANGGNGNMENQNMTYDKLEQLSANKFSYVGYDFIYWSYNGNNYSDLANVINLTDKSETIILTANWEEHVYNITYDLAGGTASGNPQTFTYVNNNLNDLLTNINKPTKANYEFSHWLLNDIEITETTTLPAADIKLTAVYKPITYYVTFTNCDGLDQLEFNVLEVKDLPIPTKDGYVFGGWKLGNEVISNTSNLTNNVTVSAIWNPITYNITYVLYGAANNNINTTYTVENNVTFSDAVKEDYKFIGWYLDSNFETEIKSTKGHTKNLVLYAKFEVETYTISLDLAGGSGIDEVTYNVEVNKTLPTPTKAGYKFIGFIDDNDNIITETKDLIGNINLTAKYEIITYKIDYSLDGGINNSNNPDSYNVEEIVEFNNPTKVGYKFIGWYLDSSFETPISSTTNYNRDLVLYAKFELITYTLILGDKEIKYSVEKVEQLPILEKAGYLFGGWNIDGVARFNTAGLVGDYTGSAIWTLINYNISYSLDGGINNSNNPNSYNVEEIVEFNNPTKVGYKFVGWYLDNEYKIKIDSTKDYSKDLVLYAKFIPNEYKISFNTKDSYIEGQTFNDVMISYNSKFGDKLPIPKAEFGITFHYWYYLDGDDKVIVNNNTIYDFTNDLVLYAYTEVTNYNIVYETNGGVNSDKNITNLTAFDVADGKTINIYSPTKAGYTFVGWYLDSNFNGDKIDVIDTALIENNINNVIRLYAKYEVHKFNINFYNGDTTNLISSIEVSYGQKIKPITAPQKEGYIFDNWYLDGISIYDFNSPVISDLNIIALYKITEVKLSANINGELVDVVVTSIDGKGLQADTRISIELVTDSNIINSSNELLTEFGRISRLYNIKLVDANGNTIQPEGQVRIALTLPNEELKGNERFSIVNIKDDISGYTLFDSNSEDGTITFNTTHFSYYGIIITDKIVDWTWLWVLLGVVAFILLQFLIVLLIKNRRFRIRFISKGDVKIRELKYKKDEKVSLPKPQRLGYRFVGWYLDSEFKHPAHITTMPNENLILYARWQEDPLTIGLIVKNRKK